MYRVAITSIAAKIGCAAETLRGWFRDAKGDHDVRVGETSDERKRIKAVEPELHSLWQANEALQEGAGAFRADSDEAGHPFRSEAGRRSDLKPASLPI